MLETPMKIQNSGLYDHTKPATRKRTVFSRLTNFFRWCKLQVSGVEGGGGRFSVNSHDFSYEREPKHVNLFNRISWPLWPLSYNHGDKIQWNVSGFVNLNHCHRIAQYVYCKTEWRRTGLKLNKNWRPSGQFRCVKSTTQRKYGRNIVVGHSIYIKKRKTE
jgi:hypothetical protein